MVMGDGDLNSHSCDTSWEGHIIPTAKAYQVVSFKGLALSRRQKHSDHCMLTFVLSTLSGSDKVMTSPAHSFTAFTTSALMITRRAARGVASAKSASPMTKFLDSREDIGLPSVPFPVKYCSSYPIEKPALNT